MNCGTALLLVGISLVAAFKLRAVEPVSASAAVGEESVETRGAGEWAAVRGETMRLVWSTVQESYFDETFGGVNWSEVGERYRAKLPTVTTNEELRELLNAMIGELRVSHFAILPREMSVFTPQERSRSGTVGAEVDWLEGQLIVVGVKPDSPAARAGIQPGVRLTAVDGNALDPLLAQMQALKVSDQRAGAYLVSLVSDRLRGAVDAVVELQGTDATGRSFAHTLTCAPHPGAWSEPMGNFPSLPVDCETRRDPSGVAYLRFNVFAPVIMKQVRTFLRSLQPDDGLIIDLRGNAGGLGLMAAAISGWLVDRELSLGDMRLRKGVLHFPVYPQEGAFLGPVAVLIDGRSASTSEILAAGLRDHGRVRLFGSHTAGAALPSVFRALPTGDLFQYAIADIRTPKHTSIEGKGVAPDERVALAVSDLVAHRDAVEEKARAWLQETRARRVPVKTARSQP